MLRTIQSMSKIVFVHGYHVGAGAWDDVVFGSPDVGRLGRACAGLVVGYRTKSDLVVLGSGASHRDGLSEAALSLSGVKARSECLAELVGVDVAAWDAWVDSHVVLDEASLNTVDEIRYAFDLALLREASAITLVSSPVHLARCLAAGLAVCEEPRYTGLRRGLGVHASDTNFENFDARDVVVVEPPHRADRPWVRFDVLARRMFGVLGSEALAKEYEAKWEELLNSVLATSEREHLGD